MTDTVFLPLSEVCDVTVSLGEMSQLIYIIIIIKMFYKLYTVYNPRDSECHIYTLCILITIGFKKYVSEKVYWLICEGG